MRNVRDGPRDDKLSVAIGCGNLKRDPSLAEFSFEGIACSLTLFRIGRPYLPGTGNHRVIQPNSCMHLPLICSN